MNTETKHTPGPWINWSDSTPIDIGNGDGPIPMHEIQGHFNLETGDGGTVGYVFGQANARLIAAAPELLAALEAFSDAYAARWGDLDVWLDFLAKANETARLAIAKAKGGTP